MYHSKFPINLIEFYINETDEICIDISSKSLLPFDLIDLKRNETAWKETYKHMEIAKQEY